MNVQSYKYQPLTLQLCGHRSRPFCKTPWPEGPQRAANSDTPTIVDKVLQDLQCPVCGGIPLKLAIHDGALPELTLSKSDCSPSVSWNHVATYGDSSFTNSPARATGSSRQSVTTFGRRRIGIGKIEMRPDFLAADPGNISPRDMVRTANAPRPGTVGPLWVQRQCPIGIATSDYGLPSRHTSRAGIHAPCAGLAGTAPAAAVPPLRPRVPRRRLCRP